MERTSDPIFRGLSVCAQLVWAKKAGGKTAETANASPDCDGLDYFVVSVETIQKNSGLRFKKPEMSHDVLTNLKLDFSPLRIRKKRRPMFTCLRRTVAGRVYDSMIRLRGSHWHIQCFSFKGKGVGGYSL